MAFLAKHSLPGGGAGYEWTVDEPVVEVKDEALARELIAASHGDIYQVDGPAKPEPKPEPSKAVSEVVDPEDFTAAPSAAPARRGRPKASEK